MKRKLWRRLGCLFGRHDNARCTALGWRPLFPVVCDDCRELFYVRMWTDAEREAHEARLSSPLPEISQ